MTEALLNELGWICPGPESSHSLGHDAGRRAGTHFGSDTTQSHDSLRFVAHWIPMSRVEQVEEAIQALDPEELAEFRAWFAEYDWGLWDQQLERDATTGRLDRLADEALREHTAGNTAPL